MRRISERGGPNGARYTLEEIKFAEEIGKDIAASSGKVWSRNPRLDEAIEQLAARE
jgi:hypothetical protein